MTCISKKLFRAGALIVAMTLAGCSGMELDRAKGLSPQGSDFSKGLYSGYIKLSTSEFAEHDYADSDAFAMRAAASTKGSDVFPEGISKRKLPKGKVGELSLARTRLVSALDNGARERVPGAAANAQVMFDCWMQEQEENFQPKDIARCRAGFMAAMKKLEVKPRKMAAKPKPKPKPMAKPMKVHKKFVVFFAFDSSKISNASHKKIMEATAVAKGIKAKRVYVSGHTDRAGTGNYNLDLSERRAQAVVGQLIGGGLSARKVSFGSFGENVQAVKTKDGKRADRNRRVEIEIAN
jgi:OmpA-OmpF porin, OOP family